MLAWVIVFVRCCFALTLRLRFCWVIYSFGWFYLCFVLMFVLLVLWFVWFGFFDCAFLLLGLVLLPGGFGYIVCCLCGGLYASLCFAFCVTGCLLVWC